MSESRVSGSARALPFDPGFLVDVLRHLDKTIRARQLYPGSNPVVLRAVEQLRGALGALWRHTALVRVQVTETTLAWQGVTVLDEAEKGSQSLPWTLFKDGVREVTLQQGFEVEEVDWLIEIVLMARRSQELEDDMLTLLWEREFACFGYAYVETALGADAPLDVAATPGRLAGADMTTGPVAAIAAFKASAASTPAPAANDAASLTHDEAQQLEVAVDEEYRLDLRATVIELLGEIYERRAGDPLRLDVARRFDTMLSYLLSHGHFVAAARLLHEADRLRQQLPGVAADVTARLVAMDAHVNEPGVLAELLTAAGAADAPGALVALVALAPLAPLFEHLVPASLEPVIAALAVAPGAPLKALLETTADRLAVQRPAELARVMQSADSGSVRVAARRAGVLQLPETIPSLGRLLASTDRALRAEAVQSLIAIGTPPAIKALERTLTDADAALRVAALRALAEHPSPSFAPRVTQLVSAPEMRALEHRERRALFELYASVAGERSVTTLDALLNAKAGLFGKREDSDVRACAAMALGRVGSAEALAALGRSAADKDPVVKRAVEIALDGRGA